MKDEIRSIVERAVLSNYFEPPIGSKRTEEAVESLTALYERELQQLVMRIAPSKLTEPAYDQAISYVQGEIYKRLSELRWK